ncbi:MAG TPA: hypothetical protein VFW35_06825 [Sphingomicrobium sp.]|nr:hypothetical protein [Sphingomicrobium sp.]
MTATHQSNGSVTTGADRVLFWGIALSNAGFVAILALAAYWDHTIIWLHLFQSFQNVAIVLLAARRNRWAYFLGIASAAFWIYLTTFISNFAESGVANLGLSLHAGTIVRADQVIAVPAFIFQLSLILTCLIAYLRLAARPASDWLRFLGSLVGVVAYLIACIAVLQPRYLVMVPRLLHPHGLCYPCDLS